MTGPRGGSMIVAVPVTPEGRVDPRWGKASQVAVARVDDGEISSWEEHTVGWDRLHDEGTHGSHHARIVRFLRDHHIDAVVIDHCGAPMLNVMQKMGLVVVVDAEGPAREVIGQAAPTIHAALTDQQTHGG